MSEIGRFDDIAARNGGAAMSKADIFVFGPALRCAVAAGALLGIAAQKDWSVIYFAVLVNERLQVKGLAPFDPAQTTPEGLYIHVCRELGLPRPDCSEFGEDPE